MTSQTEKPKTFHEFSNQHKDDYAEFDRIEKKRSQYRDIHAMLLLEEIEMREPQRPHFKMLSCAEHDEVWFYVDPKLVMKQANKRELLELVRCGVMETEHESLSMFV